MKRIEMLPRPLRLPRRLLLPRSLRRPLAIRPQLPRVLSLVLALSSAGLPGGATAQTGRDSEAPRTDPTRPEAAGDRPTVLATLPAVGALVREVAGDRVKVIDLARPDEDPHFVQPTPLLMRRARDAAALFEIGMRLEMWADQVAAGSGNPSLQRGRQGRVVLSEGVPALEVPTRIDAAQGDIHPQGNPHLWLDPVRAKMLAANAAQALAELFPEHAAEFRGRLADFQGEVDRRLYGPELLETVSARRLDRAVLGGTLHTLLDRPYRGRPLSALAGGWLAEAAPLAGTEAVEYHKVWVYFANTFGMDLVGVVEAYPGVRPGPGHVQEVVELVRRRDVPRVLVDDFYERDLPRHVAEKGGADLVILNSQPRPGQRYFDLMDGIVDRLNAAGPERPEGGATGGGPADDARPGNAPSGSAP